MYDLIKQLCQENGTTPTKLCAEITGSSGNLPTWKKGNINSASLVKIADYFNVSVDFLLGRTSNRQIVNQINTGNVGDNSSVNVNHNSESENNLDEMSGELLKAFKTLSFEDKLDVLNVVMEKKKVKEGI